MGGSYLRTHFTFIGAHTGGVLGEGRCSEVSHLTSLEFLHGVQVTESIEGVLFITVLDLVTKSV